MKPRTKLPPFDYAVIIGGPVVCLLIIWFGIRGITGGDHRPNPVQLLRDGAIPIGMEMEDVTSKLGRANREETLADGTHRFIYTRTMLEGSGSDSLDEAQVDFTPAGRVQGIKFERSSPPATK